MNDILQKTALHAAHVRLGAKMVPFAGYDMPVHYPTGVVAEHLWTRQQAGLFDVSHMGQATLRGPDFATTARVLEHLVPADVMGLAVNQQRYTQLLNAQGGIFDDLMVTRAAQEGEIHLVVNAARKAADYALIEQNLSPQVKLVSHDDLALLALQGPKAEAVLSALDPAVADLAFMRSGPLVLDDIHVHAWRSGYTGEDGFELSMKATDALPIWDLLLENPLVKPIGLGARDSLRLEAGLCLYGHDIDETTSPNEAGLLWSIAKRRRETGGFVGATRVLTELQRGVNRMRVGIKPEGRALAREGTVIQNAAGREIGQITSGGFGPTVNGPVAMGYVDAEHAEPGTPLWLVVRGKALPASVVNLPFVPNRFKR